MSSRITNAERAMHLESAPRHFAHGVDRETADAAHETFDRMAEMAETLRPKDAVRLAQLLLVHVEADGIGYEDFQSAQAVGRYVRRAIYALRGLSLV